MTKETASGQYHMSRQFLSLGTLNKIEIYDASDERLIDKAVKRVAEIDDKMSVFKPESDIARINGKAGLKPAAAGYETLLLLQKAKKFSEHSGGSFDITIRPLAELWGINKKHNFIPQKSETAKAMNLVCYNDLEIDMSKGSAYLHKTGQAADLGGIAKGYAADEVRRILTEGGVKSALINLGGNIIAVGNSPYGRPWRTGIQNPASKRGDFLGILSVSDKAVATSGSNEQFFIKDAVRYHHIIDPRTGMPAQSGLLSVTVVADNSTDADALSTAVFVLGMERGTSLLEKYNADAVFAANDDKIYLTKRLIHKFEAKAFQ